MQKEIKGVKSKLPDTFNESMNLKKKTERFDFNQITDYFLTDDFKLEDL